MPSALDFASARVRGGKRGGRRGKKVGERPVKTAADLDAEMEVWCNFTPCVSSLISLSTGLLESYDHRPGDYGLKNLP